MKRIEIVLGGTYTDGKKGVRKVVAEGKDYQLYSGQTETDCLQYEQLAGMSSPYPRGKSAAGNQLLNSTRTSFALTRSARR